jgi:hypothetical protein
MADDQPEQSGEIELPIEWYIPDAIASTHVTNLVIQYTPSEFIVSFFEIKPPMLVGVPNKEVLESIKSIRADCVARIIVSPDRMPGFVNALQTNLENFLSNKSSKQTTEEK